jgi:hypothetical protein
VIIRKILSRGGIKDLNDDEIIKRCVIDSTDNPNIMVPMSFKDTCLHRPLLKIAYEMACTWLDDEYVYDVSARNIREVFNPNQAMCNSSVGAVVKGKIKIYDIDHHIMPYWWAESTRNICYINHTDE